MTVAEVRNWLGIATTILLGGWAFFSLQQRVSDLESTLPANVDAAREAATAAIQAAEVRALNELEDTGDDIQSVLGDFFERERNSFTHSVALEKEEINGALDRAVVPTGGYILVPDRPYCPEGWGTHGRAMLLVNNQDLADWERSVDYYNQGGQSEVATDKSWMQFLLCRKN